MPELKDLKDYAVDGVGGTHGLTDVTDGIVTLGKLGLPYCKIHGDMVKVSNDGIWRCLDPVHHGAYFDNRNLDHTLPKNKTPMKRNELILCVVAWLLPFVAAIYFQSMYPLFGWVGSTLIAYFVLGTRWIKKKPG